MAGGVDRAFEPIGHVVAVRKTGVLCRLRGGVAALAAATDEVDLVISAQGFSGNVCG